MRKIFCVLFLFLFSFVSLFAETAGKWSIGYAVEDILDFDDRVKTMNDGNIIGNYWFNDNENLGINFDLAFGSYKEYGDPYFYDGMNNIDEYKISKFKISFGLNNVIAESGNFRLYSNENIYYTSKNEKINGEKIDTVSGSEFGIAVGINAEYFLYENFSLALRTDVLSFTSSKNDYKDKNETSLNLVDTICPTLEAKYYF